MHHTLCALTFGHDTSAGTGVSPESGAASQGGSPVLDEPSPVLDEALVPLVLDPSPVLEVSVPVVLVVLVLEPDVLDALVLTSPVWSPPVDPSLVADVSLVVVGGAVLAVIPPDPADDDEPSPVVPPLALKPTGPAVLLQPTRSESTGTST